MAYKFDPKAPTTKLGELLANSITHGVGIGLSIAGLVVLIVRAVRLGTGWHLAGSSCSEYQPSFYTWLQPSTTAWQTNRGRVPAAAGS